MTLLVSRKKLKARRGKGRETEKEEKTKGRTISEHFLSHPLRRQTIL